MAVTGPRTILYNGPMSSPTAPSPRVPAPAPKAKPGDRIAVLSPSVAAPAIGPGIHEQAMRRLRELTGLEPVEYPTTRRLDASPKDRAADVNAALADPSIRAILATVGGDDQITVLPYLEPDLLRADPKPFFGYSDNFHLHHWWWSAGVRSFYGGSTQVQLGPGPAVDEIHARALRAALLDGGTLEITDPGESEDHGWSWTDPRALTESGERVSTADEPWIWSGPARRVSGPSWGGCLEVVRDVLGAGHLHADADAFQGGVLLAETSEELIPPLEVARILRLLGERGILAAVDAVLVARPPVGDFERHPDAETARRLRADQRAAAAEVVQRYNPDAVICAGVPFGHTRPQWILPHGGTITVDGEQQRVWADYS
jgi:muramoyltetrapeptide carboxypeptidase LdcA involved in peptidoglycan recycling